MWNTSNLICEAVKWHISIEWSPEMILYKGTIVYKGPVNDCTDLFGRRWEGFSQRLKKSMSVYLFFLSRHQGYTGNKFSDLGSFFSFSLIGATYQLYVSFYQIGLSSTSDICSAVIDGISPPYPVIHCKRCYPSSLTAYFLTLFAYLLKHWKPTKACQTTTMQSIWCDFVTRSLFGTLNYWKSQLAAILDLNFRRSEFFFPAWRPDLPN